MCSRHTQFSPLVCVCVFQAPEEHDTSTCMFSFFATSSASQLLFARSAVRRGERLHAHFLAQGGGKPLTVRPGYNATLSVRAHLCHGGNARMGCSGSKGAVATPAPATAQGAPGTAAGVVATRVGSMSSGKEQFVIGKLSLGGAGGLPDHPPAVRVCLPDGRHHHGPAAHQGKWRPRGVARAAPELSVALRRHVRRFSVNVQRWKGRRRL